MAKNKSAKYWKAEAERYKAQVDAECKKRCDLYEKLIRFREYKANAKMVMDTLQRERSILFAVAQKALGLKIELADLSMPEDN